MATLIKIHSPAHRINNLDQKFTPTNSVQNPRFWLIPPGGQVVTTHPDPLIPTISISNNIPIPLDHNC